MSQPKTSTDTLLQRVWAPNYDYPEYVHHVMGEIDRVSKKKHKLLIWIHGGRNLLGNSWKKTLKLIGPLEDSEYQLLAINWSSGDFAAYTGHLVFARPSSHLTVAEWTQRYLLKPPLVLTWDVGRAAARAPLSLLQDLSRDYTAAGESRKPVATTVDSIRFSKADGGDRGGPALRFLTGILTLPPRTAVLTVTNIFGPGEWETMRRRTQSMFDPDVEFVRRAGPNAPEPSRGCLSVLLDSLAMHTGPRSGWEVTLVGHSMGSMVSCEILRRAHDLPIRNVVFMAAACRVRDFRDCVVPYLERNPKAHFYSLMLHPVNDLTESFLPVVGSTLYRGSLLTWIDDFLTFQAATIERTFGREENALTAMRFVPKGIRNRMTLKTFPVHAPKRKRDSAGRLVPTKHSDFSNPKSRFWEPGFWQPEVGVGSVTARGR